ncbi:MAG: AAA domain-containing protein [Pseudomonadota bacterium]
MNCTAEHIPTLRRLRDRLSDLSMRNRSLRLVRLPKKRAFDLAWLDKVHAGDSAMVLERVLSGRKQSATLLQVGGDDEGEQRIHKDLTYLDREVRLVEEERGVYDLSLGFMFLCGAIAEGKYIQAPVFLVPRRLVLDRRRKAGTAWALEPLDDPREVNVNRTLLLALQKYADLTLDLESIEEAAAEVLFGERRAEGWLSASAARIADLLEKHGLRSQPTTRLWGASPVGLAVPDTELVPALPEYRAEEVPAFAVRRFELRPHAVLSRFPLADTALLTDYDDLVRILEVNPHQPLGYAGALLGDRDEIAAAGKRGLMSGRKAPTAGANRWHIEQTDESQEAVLGQVLAGRSMAVYGPPGTGKSQLIANLVASALAEGKRVLVVSQKRPALDVVAQRLGADLERFLALVHDPVRDRQALCDRILASLSHQMAQGGTANPSERDGLLRGIVDAESHFARSQEALTATSASGTSNFEAYLCRLQHPGKPRVLRVHQLPAETPASLRDAMPALRQFVEDRAWAREPGTWKADRPDFSSAALDELEAFAADELPRVVASVARLQRWNDDRPANLGDIGRTAALKGVYEALHAWCTGAASADDTVWAWVPVVQALPRPSEAIQADRQVLLGLLQLREAAEGQVLSASQPEDDLRLTEFERADALWYRFFLPSWHRCSELARAVLLAEGLAGLPMRTDIARWRHRARYTVELGAAPGRLQVLGRAGQDLTSFTEAQCEATHRVTMVAAAMVEAWRVIAEDASRVGVSMPSSTAEARSIGSCAAHALQAEGVLAGYHAAVVSLQTWVGPQARGWVDDSLDARDPSRLHRRFEDEVVVSFDRLGAADRRLAATMTRHRALVDFAVQVHDGGVEMEAELWSAFSERWIRDAEGRHPVLKDARPGNVDARRQELTRAWARLPKVNRALLSARLHDKVAGIPHRERLEIAKRAEQRRRRWPVRKLVEQLWMQGLADLLPVWLCSPETVAAVFPLTCGFFDYVVFDEASQCTLPQGLTAVFRGRTCVIAGDEQQLPPSNLFSTTLEDEDDLDEVVDEESLLSRAKAAGVDGALLWHYRSQFPELIQFSNVAFYNGGLRVSPLPVARVVPPALEWVQVQGEWTRRANEAEGALAVEILDRFLREHPELSLGVITVNRQQSDYIHDLLDQRLQVSPTFRQRYEEVMARELDSRPFIRNLENVQGDERDVIILSVAYAPDASGRVPLRFGALSQPGGERRLNVAVSRARKKMVVLCSFDPETQLQVAEQSSRGAQVLKDYLCYARAMGAPDRGSQGGGAGSQAPTHYLHATVVDHLADFLGEHGWKTDRAIGASAARVDLAIRSRHDPDRYALGVLLDGPGAAWAETAIGREVGRVEYLKRYQWPIEVISVPCLVQDRETVLGSLLKRLEAADARLDAVTPPPSVALPKTITPLPPPVLTGPPRTQARGQKKVAPVLPPRAAEPLPPEPLTKISPPPAKLVVGAGSTVRFREVGGDRNREVTLVGPTIPRGLDALRLDAPLAQALLGAEVGDFVPMELQNRTVELEILKILPPPVMPGLG